MDVQRDRAGVESYLGRSADGTTLTLVYMEQAGVGLGILLPGRELPRIVHWGRRLSDPSALLGAYDALAPQRVSGGLDQTAWPSILPTQSEAWTGAPRLGISREGVEVFCHFQVEATDLAQQVAGSPLGQCEDEGTDSGDSGVPTLTVKAADADQGVGLTWSCQLLASGLIRQRMGLINLDPTRSLAVNRLELGFPLPPRDCEVMTTTGHHLRERSPQRQPLNVGRMERSTFVGRPDFDSSLLLCAGTPGFGFEGGSVRAVHLGWSGNGGLNVERIPSAPALIGGGEVLLSGEMVLPPASARDRTPPTYTTPWLYGSWGEGLNQVAQRFHEHLRSLHPGFATRPRPVTLNTWEAVYFDHSYKKLAALADKAALAGVERFVVDDGWFAGRRSDESGLGDWFIDTGVWPEGPQGLEALASKVHQLGMEFGLWFEPEMVSPDSVVFREHPDWVMKPLNSRLPVQGRSQQVMDLTNPQAYDHVFQAMDSLVSRLGIDYIKWDHNRYVIEACSPLSGRPAVHEQTEAVYRIMRDLKTRHGNLEIETCSSGGARIDLGILEYTDRVWVSDCVDPVERADIQRYTSLLVPPEMMGEHVGDSPAHSTGRATSLQLRAAMTFFGHMGVEWDLLKVSQEQLDELGCWIAAYKERRELFRTGRLVHGDAFDPAIRLDGVIATDGSLAVYRFTQLASSVNYPAQTVALPGLNPEENYRVRPLEVCRSLAVIGGGQSPLAWWEGEGAVLPGAVLVDEGLRPPVIHPAEAVVFQVERI